MSDWEVARGLLVEALEDYDASVREEPWQRQGRRDYADVQLLHSWAERTRAYLYLYDAEFHAHAHLVGAILAKPFVGLGIQQPEGND